FCWKGEKLCVTVVFILQLTLKYYVVDHYENPRNVGSFYKNAKNVGTGLVGAPACGDVMKLQIQVDEKGKIVDARFKTFWLWLMGKGQIDQPKFTLKIKNTDIAKELSLPPVKLHCSIFTPLSQYMLESTLAAMTAVSLSG
uniref:Iron-sulfur cluster assembly enzyme a n=1 Tax=Hucho hucho TaxID=62062 RepID=A0A4W5M5Q9_9TELE